MVFAENLGGACRSFFAQKFTDRMSPGRMSVDELSPGEREPGARKSRVAAVRCVNRSLGFFVLHAIASCKCNCHAGMTGVECRTFRRSWRGQCPRTPHTRKCSRVPKRPKGGES